MNTKTIYEKVNDYELNQKKTKERFESLAKNMIKIDEKHDVARGMILSNSRSIDAIVDAFARDTKFQIDINNEMNKRTNVLYYLFGILLFLWLILVGFITYLVFL